MLQYNELHAVFTRRRSMLESRLTTPRFDVLTARPLARPSHCEVNKVSLDTKHFRLGYKEIDDTK